MDVFRKNGHAVSGDVTPFMVVDLKTGDVSFSNKFMQELLGVSKVDNILSFLSPKECRDFHKVSVKGGQKFSFYCTLITKSGEYLRASLNFYNVADKTYCRVESSRQDTTYVQRLERDYERTTALLELSGALLAEFSPEGNLNYATSSFAEYFNIKEFNNGLKDYISRGLVFPDDLFKCSRLLEQNLCEPVNYVEELRVLTFHGYKWIGVTVRGLTKHTGELDRVLVKIIDIEEYKNSASAWQLRAETDELTGCFKRSYLVDKLNSIKLDRGYLAFFDIDNFKGINDTFGHLIGDEALKQVAESSKLVFGLDGDIVCRFGGDEFCIFSLNRTREEFEIGIQKLQSRVCKVELDGRRPLSISVGIGHISEDINNVHSLLDMADTALYRVKENGKNSYIFAD